MEFVFFYQSRVRMPAHQSHEWVLLALWTPGLGEKERQEGDLARKNWLIIPNFLSTSSPRKALNNFLCLFPDQSPPPPPIPTSLSASKSWGRKLEKIFFFVDMFFSQKMSLGDTLGWLGYYTRNIKRKKLPSLSCIKIRQCYCLERKGVLNIYELRSWAN